jgi:hypothetical protein
MGRVDALVSRIDAYWKEESYESDKKAVEVLAKLGGGNAYVGHERYEDLKAVKSELASIRKDIADLRAWNEWSSDPETQKRQRAVYGEMMKELESDRRTVQTFAVRVMMGKDGREPGSRLAGR